MTPPTDHIGDLLRKFYAVYGTNDEGPPPNVNVMEMFPSGSIPSNDLKTLRTAIGDKTLQKQFKICHGILDDLASRLTSEELLQELSAIPTSERDFEEMRSPTDEM